MAKKTTSLTKLVAQLNKPITAENEVEGEVAAITLGEMGEVAWPAIEALITAENADLRFWGVRSLWANGSPKANERLIALLADPDELICAVAILALGELKYEAAILHLIELMTTHPASLGNHATDALTKIGEPASSYLIEALQHPQTRVRVRAAKALIPLESKAAIRALIYCLDHDDSYAVRHYADEALKRMGVGQMVLFK